MGRWLGDAGVAMLGVRRGKNEDYTLYYARLEGLADRSGAPCKTTIKTKTTSKG